jgi:hypothetical protein
LKKEETQSTATVSNETKKEVKGNIFEEMKRVQLKKISK